MAQDKTRMSDYERGYRAAAEEALRLFDEEMNETGDVRNARQAIKTLVRFGPSTKVSKAVSLSDQPW